MKKISSMLLILILLASFAVCGIAEEAWKDQVCQQELFSTKIPAEKTTNYDETYGLMIFAEDDGVIPYVTVHRRTLDKKFINPENYLNNVLREYMEEKYGENSKGMTPAAVQEIGGKKLLGAQYQFTMEDTQVVLLRLIEIRDEGDVEYSAVFVDGNDQSVMKVLNEVVRNYQEVNSSALNTGNSGQTTLSPENWA